jgi:hypothetical protein
MVAEASMCLGRMNTPRSSASKKWASLLVRAERLRRIEFAERPDNQGRRCFLLASSADFTSRRIASDREGLSGCRLAQSSICDLSADDSRTAVTGSWPVGGRPRFFRITGIDFGINVYYVKSGLWEVPASHGPTPSHGGKPWLRLKV